MLQILRLLHAIGIAWGVGGATINSILIMKDEKNPELAPHIMKIMPSIVKMIWAAIIILIISGVFLVPLITWPIDKTMLSVKHLVVILLVLSGLNLNFRVLPKMKKLAPTDGQPSPEFLKIKKTLKISGIVGLVLWYTIMVLSVLI